ncbi:DUF6233 domain-containing protein [Streptomyces anthocyanicus]|uniref:DUF6233 domain-containing protein n=1 Tax=Streptomyces anthocyanicus TaxID=68174 RepID=UPI003414D287
MGGPARQAAGSAALRWADARGRAPGADITARADRQPHHRTQDTGARRLPPHRGRNEVVNHDNTLSLARPVRLNEPNDQAGNPAAAEHHESTTAARERKTGPPQAARALTSASWKRRCIPRGRDHTLRRHGPAGAGAGAGAGRAARRPGARASAAGSRGPTVEAAADPHGPGVPPGPAVAPGHRGRRRGGRGAPGGSEGARARAAGRPRRLQPGLHRASSADADAGAADADGARGPLGAPAFGLGPGEGPLGPGPARGVPHAPECEEAPEGVPLLDVRRALDVAEKPGTQLCTLCGCAQELTPLLSAFDHITDS